MKKIVRQQNYLKELIDSQENQYLTKIALKCIMRSILEPLLDNPEEGVVLHRISNKSGVLSLIKRLEFSSVDSFDFSDGSDLLKENVWANTEFLCVLTHRFVSIIIWDSKTDNPNYVRYYAIFNSKLQNEALDIIGRNSNLNIKDFQEHYKPDRRDNILLNSSIRHLIEGMDEASKDAVLGFAQVQSEKEAEDTQQNVREIAHEIRNQLSICDLYNEIIKKNCMRKKIDDESISNAITCISRAVKMANNSLLALKSTEKPSIKSYNLKELINNAVDLTKVYFEGKNIECIVENNCNVKIPVDENKFNAVIINLIKNATEAHLANENKKSKYIKIITECDENFAFVRIQNNANKITEPNKIFKENFTTKQNGNGLGLIICKNYIESMYGELKLEHTGNDYTEFLIKIGVVK